MCLNARPLWTLVHRALALLVVALAIPIGHAQSCVNSPPGLRHWWPADGSGADVIGSHNAARRLGAGYGTGVSDAAFALDGVDDYYAVGLLGDFALTETFAFSISAWIDPVELTRFDSPQIIASNYQGERGDNGHFSTYLWIVGGDLKFGLEYQQVASISASTSIASGWQHVTGTYDGTTLRLYVDGVLRASATRSISGSLPNSRGWNIGDASPETNASWQNLGGSPRNAAFNGRIDELQLYDRALTADEVGALHASGGVLCLPPLPSLDVDANVQGPAYAATTDGLLVLRYLLGLNGDALTANALGTGATRDAAGVITYLDGARWMLDVDDDGLYGLDTDALLILRYLFGFRGEALVTGAVGADAGRSTAAAIEAFLAALTP